MDNILHPIIVGFAWIWVYIHKLLVFLGIPDGPGIGWVLSIILMTLLVRALIFPLYMRQMKSMRNMQVIQPELQKLQAKYKGKTDAVSKQRQNEEMMALYKKAGSSPFSSCLPLLVQMPVLFGLYRVIYAVSQIVAGNYAWDNLGPLDLKIAQDIDSSTVFGVSLSQTMGSVPSWGQKAAFIVLIAVMVVVQFLTMHLSMKRNMAPHADPNNPMVRSQKMMMYMMPAMFIFTGLVFQMGLLVYMVTTTLFSWGQQYYVVRTMPTPGSPAHVEMAEKREVEYKKWAVPLFAAYDEKKTSVQKSEGDLDELNAKTLSKVQSNAKRQKVSSNFPEDWTDEEKVATYRTLAVEPWKTLPDDIWMKQLILAKYSAQAAEEAKQKRPKKLSREQRLRLSERERQEAEAAARRAERQERKEQQGTKGSAQDLTPEELEQRRQERRTQRRQQNKNKGQNRN